MSSPEPDDQPPADLDTLREGNAALRREIERLSSVESARSPFVRGLVEGAFVSAVIVALMIAAIVFVASGGAA